MPHSCAWVSRDCARVPCESARVSRDSARVPIAGSSQKRLWVSVSTLLLASTTGHRCRHCSPQTARSNSFDTLHCYWTRNCRYYSISRTGTGTGTGRSRVKKGRRSRGVDAAGVGGPAAGVGGPARVQGARAGPQHCGAAYAIRSPIGLARPGMTPLCKPNWLRMP